MGRLNESFCQIQIAITAPILGTPVIWLKPSSQIGMVVSRNKPYHRRKSRQWFEGECCLRELPQVFAKTKWWEIAESGRKWGRTQTDCFRIVFAKRKISNLEEIQVADFQCGPARA